MEKDRKMAVSPLTLEGLKLYKEKSPHKFLHKFGDLDLENLPQGFDFNAHRKAIIANLPKPDLILGSVPSEIQGMNFPTEAPKVEVPEILIPHFQGASSGTGVVFSPSETSATPTASILNVDLDNQIEEIVTGTPKPITKVNKNTKNK